jgi:glyoxalase family protein
MDQLITGIHHVTALAGDPQQNLDFYSGILGLRLVKKTVNFDAPEVYHFYYGDEMGLPGSILTFFPFEGIQKGRQGKGMLNTTTFSIPAASLDYWLKRLKQFSIDHKPPTERVPGEIILYFEDPDGLGLELVANDKDDRPGFTYGHIPLEHAIRGFYSVELWEEGYERTAAVLTEQLDHKLIAEKGNRFRFAATNKPGNYVDIVCAPDRLRGSGGGGTVHHVAFSTPNQETQTAVREKIRKLFANVTPILDRQYFKSIYFREPGGVLFEVASADIGFDLDESKEHLGEALKLPDWYEQNRTEIEKLVKPVHLDLEKFR